jgi:F0F1-type ATP synthase assembly protein I
MAMVAAPVTFGLLGALVDSQTDTGPLFLILFAFFGVAGSFASAFYRYDSRIARQNEGKPWTRRSAA